MTDDPNMGFNYGSCDGLMLKIQGAWTSVEKRKTIHEKHIKTW